MRPRSAVLLVIFAAAAVASAQEPAWTIVIHPKDFVIGAALKNLKTRRTWAADVDPRDGTFEIALRKTAVAIPAPHCRTDYLILKIPLYYPETPKKASPSERRAVYDALVALQTKDSGSITARVEAPAPIGQMSGGRGELAACNLYFVLPLSVEASP
jgi:hypothetical protein